MEKFVHVAESSKKLLNSQGVVLQNYQAFFKENLLLINGKPGSGKTYLALSIASMKTFCMKKSQILYLVPSRQAMVSLLRILYSRAIHEADTLMNSMLIVEPSEEAADLPAGLREKCL